MKVYQTNEIKNIALLGMMDQVRPPSQKRCSMRVVL